MELSEVREISFQAVLFDFDESYLTEKAKEDLDKVVRTMLKSTSIYMEIIGHTDIIGGDGYNVELSEARAQQVIQYMISKGIDESRLKMRYYGSQMPVADNTTAEGRAQNRRVEFQILQKKFELYEKN
jgi:outer membrane protein OmpA-like peptidoglycan-associated protein